jgi:CAAX prenyl protease-like protein
MVVFLVITVVASNWPAGYPILYVLKTVLAAALLLKYRRRYAAVRWNYAILGVVAGVVGIVQWIGVDKFILHVAPNYPHPTSAAFDPLGAIHPAWLAWSFVAVRWAGASLVVPFMEELFWRDYVWRTIIAPNNFFLAKIGEWDATAFFVVALAFAAEHPQWPTAIVYGLLIGGLLLYTRSLGACILCHVVTNFLLGAYVLWTNPHPWQYW